MRRFILAGLLTALLTACTPLPARTQATSSPPPAPTSTPPVQHSTTPPPPTPGAGLPHRPLTPSPAVPSTAVPSSQVPTTTAPSAPAPSAPAPSLQDAFAAFAAGESGRVSIAVAPVGSNAAPMVFGDLGRPVAWSTSKVPVAIAVERTPQGPGLRPTMRQAISASDNDAAIRLWQSLGQPAAAAAATDRVLRDFGDQTTRTQSRQVRPPFTAFGQTQWALGDQTRFAAALPCRSEAEPVYSAMGQIIPGQSWGLGRLPSAHFKGGWGPSSSGYLVRQFGVVDAPQGQVATSIAVDAPSFDQGTSTLSRAAQWLGEHLDDLPAGSC